MSLFHAVSRLVSAANRHGIFIDTPTRRAHTLALDEVARERLRGALPGEPTLEVTEMTAPDVSALTAALNRAADAARRPEAVA